MINFGQQYGIKCFTIKTYKNQIIDNNQVGIHFCYNILLGVRFDE